MTLKEIQNVNLEIMKDIHEFCMGNNIKYSLAYGTLIGAVRHRGFIPWDDDIDIMMPRPDFEKFSKTYKSKKGYFLMSLYNRDNFANYTRVYEMNDTLVISPSKACKRDVGIWVDVYPIDGISDSDEEFRKDYAEIRRLGNRILRLRHCYSITKYNNLRRIIIYPIILFYENLFNGGIQRYRELLISQCKKYVYGRTKRCGSLVSVSAIKYDKPEVFDTECFMDYELADFETEKFMIIKKYDQVLTRIFGNYMIIPPKEKQISHEFLLWKYYWKRI